MDRYPPTMQREALLRLVPALGCRDAALRLGQFESDKINEAVFIEQCSL